MAFSPVGLEDLEGMAARASDIIQRLRGQYFQPDAQKRHEVRFNLRSAAELTNTMPEEIRAAEATGKLPRIDHDPLLQKQQSYRLSDLNRIRAHFGTRPWRAEQDDPAVLAIQNFKGGVAKTTVVCHLAQFLALRGYRVCVVDCDSQASTTSIFGVNPDVDIDETKETLYPFFRHGGPRSLDYALRPTYWDGVTLIPSNLGLYDAEYEFAAKLRDDSSALDMLGLGIDTIKDQFDVVLLDPPPALGMISLSVLRAANALVIPTPPNNVDFASTMHFLQMMASTLAELARFGPPPSYKFVKFLTTKMNDGKSAHLAIKKMMDAVFAEDMLEAVLKDSAEIDTATAGLGTVYEMTGEDTHTGTHRRCRAYLDAVGTEIEHLVRQTWSNEKPSTSSDAI